MTSRFQTLSAYLKFMVDIGELLGGDRNETEDQMLRVIELEQKIANVSEVAAHARERALRSCTGQAVFTLRVNFFDVVRELTVPYF